MSQGFLLFAHNNSGINYGKMALWQAGRIQKYLAKPVSLVTDAKTLNFLKTHYPQQLQDWIDRVIVNENTGLQTKRYIDSNLEFHNLDRVSAFDLTPYDETIVIDTDILIQSNRFNKIWNYTNDLVVCKHSSNLYGETTREFQWVSDKGLEFFWATAVYFKKTEDTELFFNYCKYVKENYQWFRYVHELQSGPIRNDFVWSIAIHNLGGAANSNWVSKFPWNLLHSENDDSIIKIEKDSAVFLTPNGLCRISNQDIHILNKFNLMEYVDKEMEF
jgi:hypothetical protein